MCSTTWSRPFSGPRNLATVGLINALGASSEQGVVIDFDEYMAAG